MFRGRRRKGDASALAVGILENLLPRIARRLRDELPERVAWRVRSINFRRLGLIRKRTHARWRGKISLEITDIRALTFPSCARAYKVGQNRRRGLFYDI